MDNGDTQKTLEIILDVLCKLTDTSFFMMLPEKKEERIPYLKQEIKKVLEKVEYAKKV